MNHRMNHFLNAVQLKNRFLFVNVVISFNRSSFESLNDRGSVNVH